MAKYKIKFNKEACIGCGSCASVCPSNWVMKGNKSSPKKIEVKDIECNQEAADSCPVNAIKIEKVS